MYYVGFALESEAGMMYPWMNGSLKDEDSNTVITTAKTPTDLYTKATTNSLSNVSLYKPTSQSSLYQEFSNNFDGNKDNAVDGKVQNGFTHTENEDQSWWKVNLENTYDIQNITVYTRLECCQSRLSDFIVTVYNNGENVWTHQHPGTVGEVTIIDVGVNGDEVKVSLPGRNSLELREVQVDAFAPTEVQRNTSRSGHFIVTNLKKSREVWTCNHPGAVSGETSIVVEDTDGDEVKVSLPSNQFLSMREV